jgi:hypothetical protein
MSAADDPATKELLEQVRRAWSPGPAAAARVRRGVEGALAAPAPAMPAVPRAGTSIWARRILLAGAFTGAGAGVGYWAGRQAERREAATAAIVAPVTVGPAAPSATVPAPPALGPPEAEAAAAMPNHRRPDGTRRRPAEPPTGTPAASLAEEVRALRNIERALRDGNPGLATAFLDQLDRAVPNGQMREERVALRAIARCARGPQPFGVNLAQDFAAAYPASAYRTRVEEACGGTDSPGTGD